MVAFDLNCHMLGPKSILFSVAVLQMLSVGL